MKALNLETFEMMAQDIKDNGYEVRYLIIGIPHDTWTSIDSILMGVHGCSIKRDYTQLDTRIPNNAMFRPIDHRVNATIVTIDMCHQGYINAGDKVMKIINKYNKDMFIDQPDLKDAPSKPLMIPKPDPVRVYEDIFDEALTEYSSEQIGGFDQKYYKLRPLKYMHNMKGNMIYDLDLRPCESCIVIFKERFKNLEDYYVNLSHRASGDYYYIQSEFLYPPVNGEPIIVKLTNASSETVKLRHRSECTHLDLVSKKIFNEILLNK